MVMPKFTGKYASIRKDFYKDSVGKKYDPNEKHWVGNKLVTYKTEVGFRNAMQKKFAKDMAKIDEIENAGYPESATITVEFSRNHQARAVLRYKSTTGRYNVIESGSTHGWGYDKESTAMADCFNEAPEFMKLLLDLRAKKKDVHYGIQLCTGKPWLPFWDGGVGASSFNQGFREMGYEVRDIPAGDRVSIFEYTLKKKRR